MITNQPKNLLSVPLISAQVRPLNERLWTLFRKEAGGDITASEQTELNAMCRAIEGGQDVDAIEGKRV